MVPHSPDSIHWPSGVIATQELFRASPEPKAWTYSDQAPPEPARGTSSRCPSRLIRLDVVAVVGGVRVADVVPAPGRDGDGMVPMPV